eukprot:1195480-Prorocentrum_minimum.AAC.3
MNSPLDSYLELGDGHRHTHGIPGGPYAENDVGVPSPHHGEVRLDGALAAGVVHFHALHGGGHVPELQLVELDGREDGRPVLLQDGVHVHADGVAGGHVEVRPEGLNHLIGPARALRVPLCCPRGEAQGGHHLPEGVRVHGRGGAPQAVLDGALTAVLSHFPREVRPQ